MFLSPAAGERPLDTRFPFVDWFRNASPYINAHRGRTFVILIEGEAMASGRGEQLIQDLALLHTALQYN